MKIESTRTIKRYKAIGEPIVALARSAQQLLEARDLHINEISKRFRDRSTWIDGGIECFGCATKLRDESFPADTVCLVFYLAVSRRRWKRAVSSIAAIRHLMYSTPPELLWLSLLAAKRYYKLILAFPRIQNSELCAFGELYFGQWEGQGE